MSETRYTPHDFRKASLAVYVTTEEAVAKELAAMLRQAATDAEALEELRERDRTLSRQLERRANGRDEGSDALLAENARMAEALAAEDAELRKRSDVTTAQTIALTKLGDEYANEFNRAESLQASLTAERQKVRELREYLDNEIAVAIKCDEQAANTADANWFRGKAEGYAWAVKRMDALGLTGDATEGQG